jgi:hypothetical protein
MIIIGPISRYVSLKTQEELVAKPKNIRLYSKKAQRYSSRLYPVLQYKYKEKLEAVFVLCLVVLSNVLNYEMCYSAASREQKAIKYSLWNFIYEKKYKNL